MQRRLAALLMVAGLATAPQPAGARVVRVVIESREDVLGGRAFGHAGPYEKITGRVYFAFDPANAANARIVDLDLAPRNADGEVEAWANFMVLRPKRAARGDDVAFLEVSNRGGKAALGYFDAGRFALDPTTAEDFGDGLLMRLGLTVIWVGWQPDIPRRAGLLQLHVPVATDGGKPIYGRVRSDWVVDEPANTLPLAHRNHVAYPVADPADTANVLTVRGGRLAPRHVVPRDRWRFTPDSTHIYAPDGFEVGKIYELVYRAKNPRVVGLGLAAIRDMISYAKHDSTSPFPVHYGIGFGVSQTGRFLRHFVYQGFNVDESGRAAFDGLMIHSAGGGRGSFNHRFAQPSRDAHRYSAFFYPTDIFPFTSRTQTDPVTGKTDGLFAHTPEGALPKIFYTNSGYEYWGRSAGLITITVDGRRDIQLYPNERVYHLASGQHFVARFPPPDDAKMPGADAWRGDPLDYLVNLRALLVRMVGWVRDGTAPPPSTYPRIDAGTLVPIDSVRFPAIPGVDFPKVAQEAYRADYGPRWSEGIIEVQPPDLGAAFPVRVPQVDSLGNELGGIRNVEIQAPVATYAPWNLRIGAPAATHELTDFYGTLIPLPATEAERKRTGDPRPSLEALYAGRADYLARARAAARDLVRQGFLLDEDIDRVVGRAGALWDWVTTQDAGAPAGARR